MVDVGAAHMPKVTDPEMRVAPMLLPGGEHYVVLLAQALVEGSQIEARRADNAGDRVREVAWVGSKLETELPDSLARTVGEQVVAPEDLIDAFLLYKAQGSAQAVHDPTAGV